MKKCSPFHPAAKGAGPSFFSAGFWSVLVACTDSDAVSGCTKPAFTRRAPSVAGAVARDFISASCSTNVCSRSIVRRCAANSLRNSSTSALLAVAEAACAPSRAGLSKTQDQCQKYKPSPKWIHVFPPRMTKQTRVEVSPVTHSRLYVKEKNLVNDLGNLSAGPVEHQTARIASREFHFLVNSKSAP